MRIGEADLKGAISNPDGPSKDSPTEAAPAPDDSASAKDSKEADSNLWRAWVSRTQDFRGTSTGNIRSGRRECDLPKINHSWVSLTQERPSFGLSYPRFSGHPRNAKNRSSSAAAPG